MESKIIRRLIALGLVLVLALPLAACNEEGGKTDTPVTYPTSAPTIFVDSDKQVYSATDNTLRAKKTDVIYMGAAEIKARYGASFEDPEIQTFFDGQEWYKKNENYSDDLLNEVEKQNFNLFWTEATLKDKQYIKVTSPYKIDYFYSDYINEITFDAPTDSNKFTGTFVGFLYQDSEEDGGEKHYKTVEFDGEVPGTLTGNVYIANLVYKTSDRTLIFESKDGDTVYNTIVSFKHTPGTDRNPDRAKLDFYEVGTFIGDITNEEQVQFSNDRGKNNTYFIATWISQSFDGFTHMARLTTATAKGELAIDKYEMYNWGKEVTVAKEIDLRKSTLDRAVVATLKVGETWVIEQSDESQWLYLYKKDDPEVKGYIEHSGKLVAYIDYKYETEGNKTKETKVTGEKITEYFDGLDAAK